jgi:protease-4
MGSVAASGGYYVAAPCQWIVANDMTITGSIGVIMGSINYRGLMDKVGVVPMVYKSGKFKDMLSGTRPPGEVTEEEKQMVQNMIDEVFQRFQEVVNEGRSWSYEENAGMSQELVDDWKDYTDGRVLSGKEAHRLGFVDELGNLDVAVERVLDLASIKSANVIRYQHVVDLAELFRLFGKTDAKTVKLDLGVDMPDLLPGRLYYLSPLFYGE